MIIDSHVHFGKSIWGNFSPEFLMNILDEEVNFAICSNLEGIDSPAFKNEYEANIDILKISRKYPKLKPLLVCQPNLTENNSVIRDFLENNSEFIGLKLHPECMRLPADSEKYNKYLDLAREFKKPCLYHSGHVKSRFSSPKLISIPHDFKSVSNPVNSVRVGNSGAKTKSIDIKIAVKSAVNFKYILLAEPDVNINLSP